AVLDRNVEHILTVLEQTPTARHYAYSNKSDLKAHAQISREAAAESMVLLKDAGNTLPIRKSGATVALYGNHGYDLIPGGTGSGDVNKPYVISLAEGLTNAGYRVDEDMAARYKKYIADYAATHPKKPLIQELMNPTPYAPELAFDAASIGS